MSDESDGRGGEGTTLTDESSDSSESEAAEDRELSATTKIARLVSRKRAIGRKITVGFLILLSISVALNLTAFFYSYTMRSHPMECTLMHRPGAAAAAEDAVQDAKPGNGTEIPYWQFMSVVGLISRHRRDVVQSAMLVDVALLCFAVSVFTAMIQVVRNPEQLPKDFKVKGTLSNIVQDTRTPVGRLFTVGFFAAAICWISSMYTFTLYRPWMGIDYRTSPVGTAGLASLNAIPILSGVINLPNFEYFMRVCWVVGPAVGCMLSATIPSMSHSQGYGLAMTLVHNTLAPLSLLFCVSMESVQLVFGENAFYYFFRNEPTLFLQEFTPMQRVRTVCVVTVWVVTAVFFALQFYIGGIVYCGLDQKKTGYSVALLSFYSEVSMVFFITALPALAALDMLMDPCMSHPAAEIGASILALNRTLPVSYYLGAT